MKSFQNGFSRKNTPSKQQPQAAPPTEIACLGGEKPVANATPSISRQKGFGLMNSYPVGRIVKENKIFSPPGAGGTIAFILIYTALSLVFLYLGLISVGTLVLSGFERYVAYAILMLIASAAVFLLNTIIIVRSVSTLRFRNRFRRYAEFLRDKESEQIQKLAALSGVSEKKVIKDLQQAVEQKLIPQGHLDLDNSIFLVSNQFSNHCPQLKKNG